MKINFPKPIQKTINILLVGNNPIELSAILDKIREVRNQKIKTEIAFDITSIVERLGTFSPDIILIDDNIGREKLLQTVKKLSSNKKTKNIPITVLKNSNYHESTTSVNILDYLLKQNLSGEGLYNTLRNTLRFRRTQKFLMDAYEKRKGLLRRLTQKNVLDLIS